MKDHAFVMSSNLQNVNKISIVELMALFPQIYHQSTNFALENFEQR
jgi:hypothetical protein